MSSVNLKRRRKAFRDGRLSVISHDPNRYLNQILFNLFNLGRDYQLRNPQQSLPIVLQQRPKLPAKPTYAPPKASAYIGRDYSSSSRPADGRRQNYSRRQRR